MPNAYFRFKQFTIEQENCAMKVSTLACILGAFARHNGPVYHILDIGTGTGLLALMLAQAYPHAKIDALEVESNASEQAMENIQNSPWRDQVTVINEDFLKAGLNRQYDLIVSNPPFFENYKKASDANVNLARHVDELTISSLMQKAGPLLGDNGLFYLLLPPYEMEQAILDVHSHSLKVNGRLNIYNFDRTPVKAVICAFGHNTKNYKANSLVIRNDQDNYTAAFTHLLKPYYLYL